MSSANRLPRLVSLSVVLEATSGGVPSPRRYNVEEESVLALSARRRRRSLLMWHPITSPSALAKLLADGRGAGHLAAPPPCQTPGPHHTSSGQRPTSTNQLLLPPPPRGRQRGGCPIKTDWFLNVAAAVKTPLEQRLLALIHLALAAVPLLLGGAARGSAAWPAGG